MVQPPSFVDPNLPTHVCRSEKSLYGLKQAPRAWYKELSNSQLQLGLQHSKSNSSLFIYNCAGVVLFFLVYVDDLLITGSEPLAITRVVNQLRNRFSLKDLGPLHYFLGAEAVPVTNGLFLSQQKYIRDLLLRTKMDGAKAVTTPLATKEVLQLHDGSPPADPTEYHRLIVALQYLSLTRPDIAFSVNKLAQFMHQLSLVHWTATKCVLCYLKGTFNHGIFLRDTRCSTSAYFIFLGDCPISWSTSKQRAVARSSTKAEYRALASATCELMWIRALFHELGIPLPKPPSLFCDNIGATLLSLNPVLHSRMKHIAVDLHFIRYLVSKGMLHISHVSTHDQLADLLTKALSRQRFQKLCTKIGLSDGSPILRGRIKESI